MRSGIDRLTGVEILCEIKTFLDESLASKFAAAVKWAKLNCTVVDLLC